MKRINELFFVLAVVGVVMHFVLKPEKSQEVERPMPAATAVSVNVPKPAGQTVSMGEVVPDFVLTDSEGVQATHKAGEGPLLVVLTATGCGECLQRINGADVQAYDMAHQAGVPVWNLLVYHPDEGAASFQEQHKPHADKVLADPTSAISVKLLGGSDSTCWILLDKEGKLAYRAGTTPEHLEAALRDLGKPAE